MIDNKTNSCSGTLVKIYLLFNIISKIIHFVVKYYWITWFFTTNKCFMANKNFPINKV